MKMDEPPVTVILEHSLNFAFLFLEKAADVTN
jgi:hypothetical protein